eukprot:235728_1
MGNSNGSNKRLKGIIIKKKFKQKWFKQPNLPIPKQNVSRCYGIVVNKSNQFIIIMTNDIHIYDIVLQKWIRNKQNAHVLCPVRFIYLKGSSQSLDLTDKSTLTSLVTRTLDMSLIGSSRSTINIQNMNLDVDETNEILHNTINMFTKYWIINNVLHRIHMSSIKNYNCGELINTRNIIYIQHKKMLYIFYFNKYVICIKYDFMSQKWSGMRLHICYFNPTVTIKAPDEKYILFLGNCNEKKHALNANSKSIHIFNVETERIWGCSIDIPIDGYVSALFPDYSHIHNLLICGYCRTISFLSRDILLLIVEMFGKSIQYLHVLYARNSKNNHWKIDFKYILEDQNAKLISKPHLTSAKLPNNS